MGLTQRLRHLEHTTLDPWFERRLRRIIGPTGERVLSKHRRHWLVLVGPAVLAFVGSLVMLVASQPRTWLLLFAIGTVLLDRWRHSWSDLRTMRAAAVWLVPLLLTSGLPGDLFRASAILALLVYLLVVVARWWCEVLVVTETALWRIWGVVTTASPKAPLTSLLFQDVRQSATEQALRCGTLRFDTASDKDDPLASYGPISEPFTVSADIHRQRLEVSRGGRTAQVFPPTPPAPVFPPTLPTPPTP
jgi:hypothetical protein